MNNRNIQISIVAVIVLFSLALGGFLVWNGYRIRTGEQPNESSLLPENEARIIAEASCIKGGAALSGGGTYNPNSKTWWFDANLNATWEGCHPACVVSEETKTAEINWRCTGLVPSDQADPALPPLSEPPLSDACGIVNCHGLDIVCGIPAEACTMMYQLGDKCRSYAKCGQVNGTCQKIETAQYIACASCVRKCEKDFPNDPEKAFACESGCGE